MSDEMGRLGLGVLTRMLGGNQESVETFRAAVGKRITELSLGSDDALHFVLEDGSKFKLYDDGQSCCESRYMRTDDDLTAFVGATLQSAETCSAPNVEDQYGEHEVQFLIVTTSKGAFTMATHNEHNGYYGGFYVIAAAE